jgi:N-acetylglucosamine kinase-like BadF-type ATPase
VTICLGIDAGGTSTRAILVAADGTCLGYGRAGGGNPISWGPEAAARSVAEAVGAAVADLRSRHLEHAGRAVELAGPAAMAMAGGSGAASSEIWSAVLADAGVHGGVVAESDLLATFCAGTAELDGYAVVSGTGASAIRVTGGQVDEVVDGLGWLLGDEGSGFWIGQAAVRAALAALDGRGPETTLTAAVLAGLGVSEGVGTVGGRPNVLARAVSALYQLRPVELSGFARSALDGAAAGDHVAEAIVADARDRLLHSLSAAHRSGHHGPVVLGGGIALRLPGLADAVADLVRPWAADPPQVVTVEDGTVGTAMLALRHAGILVDAAVFDRLVGTLAASRARA